MELTSRFAPANGNACPHALCKTLEDSTEGKCNLRPTHPSVSYRGQLCRFQQVYEEEHIQFGAACNRDCCPPWKQMDG